MKILVFGNADLEMDSVPLKILPSLKKEFPKDIFEIKDPNEELDIGPDSIIIDTVVGIEKIEVFTEIEKFSRSPRITMHDFDLATQLKYLKKLGKLPKLKIIGVPPTIPPETALKEISAMLRSNRS